MKLTSKILHAPRNPNTARLPYQCTRCGGGFPSLSAHREHADGTCPDNRPKPIRIAEEFIKILRGWLTEDEIAEINAINAENDNRFCATHDYCDPSVAMLEAFEKITGESYLCDDYNNGLIDGAWNIARELKFGEVK